MKIITKLLALPTIAALALAFSSTANSATFGVRVISDDGTPVSGAAVCIGTHGNYKQFGSFFTSTSGDVMVDVPAVPLVVTISKNRFTGLRMAEPARRFNLVKEVRLLEGVPGPRCRADSAMAEADTGLRSPSLKINDVSVVEGIYSVFLKPSVDGSPSHYRLSRNSSFDGSRWQAFDDSIDIDESLLGKKDVYFQVRRYKSAAGAAIEAHSNVVKVDLTGV